MKALGRNCGSRDCIESVLSGSYLSGGNPGPAISRPIAYSGGHPSIDALDADASEKRDRNIDQIHA
ncbi:hypothetical protein [Labrys neptuniae]